MPELPEVETMRRGLAPLVGGVITAVEKPRCGCRPISVRPGWPRLKSGLLRRRIRGFERRGKRLILLAEPEDQPAAPLARLVIEPRMTGLVSLDDVPDRQHLRLRLAVQGAKADQLLFWDRRGLGTLRLFADEVTFEAALGRQRIGPDALECSLADFRELLGSSRRAIKVALLDQAKLAGVGNLYASEMLHVSRIHPATACCELTAGQWRKLYAAMRDVLETAIRYEGSTLSDGTYRNALNQAGGYQNQHRVYDRAGENCPRRNCGQILRIVQAQRATFYCPGCQKLRA